ncbi:hypothetical protein GKC34_09460, partial [Lactobacillus salivarius]|nr:hypothetical protein [Ligilactobacillus salivarius]
MAMVVSLIGEPIHIHADEVITPRTSTSTISSITDGATNTEVNAVNDVGMVMSTTIGNAVANSSIVDASTNNS